MKKILLYLAFFAIFGMNAQMLDPVKWHTRVEKKSDTEFLLIMKATIEKGWHLYSQFTPDGGALPSEFVFKNQQGNFERLGKVAESTFEKVYNDVFKVEECFFENEAVFTQRIKIKNTKTSKVLVAVSYQACNEACIQQNKTFEFKIPEVPIASVQTEVAANKSSTSEIAAKINQVTPKAVQKESEATVNHPKKKSKKGFVAIFFIAFLSGFAALLTPCVFPMIPMTVSFFTKQSKSKAAGIKNAIVYGLSIIGLYVLLGTLVTGLFGADALNELATNVWFNIIFFVLLIVFATSFLGAFEIMLPNSWANKVDKQADKGGVIGILFMALALAIVSFSCTGPIVGTLLVEAASKGGLAPVIGMLGFSMALALPFMLFAMFPGWLNSMPKSGGWLNTVKVVLGFLELALAFKFLSNADLVLQLHFLERETFLAIWIAIFGVLALYLLGKITLPHDSPSGSISVGRLLFGLFVLSFTLYMIPGLWGAPLKIISGFPPSPSYSESPKNTGSATENKSTTAQLPKGAHLGAHGIVAFQDYDLGLAYAKKVNKPVLLDFTGYACVNCRKMEDYVWSDPIVLNLLLNEVVLISLYVDDKRELPVSEQYISKDTGESIESIGDKWSDFQITRYKANAQPYYVIMNPEGKDLSLPIGYTSDEIQYGDWIKKALQKKS
ncbi:thiol:disulfide interchange protein [Flavobacterium sp. ZT3R18]|uniref:protein-disulfide reductase DsbD family protein n=1 Tax=Flavobacterium sp. ZT3R18 TaxID=2594429 RepID=UPI00117A029D|nr:cytochrome c biogenesis protein CcdA [Flavobacterium sp. ZT3R18]TRX32766.1 thiol:disulfide interchange protein [Flavobacterium sp. ZT3R18]